jgi:hypothetical protein
MALVRAMPLVKAASLTSLAVAQRLRVPAYEAG